MGKKLLPVPDRRRFGHVNVVCVRSIHMCGQEGRKRQQWGLGKGTKNGAVYSENGASKGRGLRLHTYNEHQSK